MLKTKLFSDIDPERFETNLNEFIKDKEIVDIHYQTFPIQAARQNGDPVKGEIVDRVLVVYKEGEEAQEEPNNFNGYTSWAIIEDFATRGKIIRCAKCGKTLDFDLLHHILPAACPCCGGITK